MTDFDVGYDQQPGALTAKEQATRDYLALVAMLEKTGAMRVQLHALLGRNPKAHEVITAVNKLRVDLVGAILEIETE